MLSKDVDAQAYIGIECFSQTLSMVKGSMPRSMSKQADMVYGKKTRLTANPVQFPTTTGVFLILKHRSSVCKVRQGQSHEAHWGGIHGLPRREIERVEEGLCRGVLCPHDLMT